MSYTALYRKFRPDNFDDVKGQDHIVTTLTNQIKANRIGHAYLFCGTRGTGKTTVAKILAKAHRLFLLFPARQPVEQHHCQNNDADDKDDADHPDQHHRQRGHPRSKMKHAITSVKPSGSGSGRLQ